MTWTFLPEFDHPESFQSPGIEIRTGSIEAIATGAIFDHGAEAARAHAGQLFGLHEPQWRYCLWRMWDHIGPDEPPLVVIGLNPSTATESQDDPTIRRCIGFAKRWGCGGLMMLNLFAYRSTDPGVLKKLADPVGRFNSDAISYFCTPPRQKVVLAAWGAHGRVWGRSRTVRHLLSEAGIVPVCLGVTASGEPTHPLYVPANREPVPLN